MASSSPLRLQIEHALAARIPGALSPRTRTVVQREASGIPAVDRLLGGGLPAGAITELVGSSCSGRTSLALAFAAQVTQSGSAVAWIDVADALDPESAATAGVDLSRQLWVRCGKPATTSVPLSPQQPAATGLLCGESHRTSPSGGGGSPHPRNEVRGMPEAISAFLERERWCTSENPGAPAPSGISAPAATLETHYPNPVTHDGENPAEARRRRKGVGTPGMPNRPLTRTPDGLSSRRPLDRQEQPPTDRQPSRRGKHFDHLHHLHHFHREPREPATTMACCAETPAMRQEARQANGSPAPTLNKAALASIAGDGLQGKRESRQNGRLPAGSLTWTALDQAIRAADLLLNAGGFSAIVLDLGSTPAEFSWRVPLATWFRFRAAAERSRTSVLLLTQHPCARSSAELVLRLGAIDVAVAGNLLTGMNYEVTVSRQRFTAAEDAAASAPGFSLRKPPQNERGTVWSHPAAWSPFDLKAALPMPLPEVQEPEAQPTTPASWTVIRNPRRESTDDLPLTSALRSV